MQLKNILRNGCLALSIGYFIVLTALGLNNLINYGNSINRNDTTISSVMVIIMVMAKLWMAIVLVIERCSCFNKTWQVFIPLSILFVVDFIATMIGLIKYASYNNVAYFHNLETLLYFNLGGIIIAFVIMMVIIYYLSAKKNEYPIPTYGTDDDEYITGRYGIDKYGTGIYGTIS